MLPPTVSPPSSPAVAGPPMVPGLPSSFGRPPGLQPAFNPWDLVQCLKRRWLLAGFLGIIATAGAVVGAYYYFLQPAKWMSTATAHVRATQPYNYYRPDPEPEGAYANRVREEALLAKDIEVVRRALQDPEVEGLLDFLNLTEKRRLDWIWDRLETNGNAREQSVSIFLVSSDHQHWMAPLCNALTRAYVAVSNEREHAARQEHFEERHRRYMENGGDVLARIDELRRKQREVGSPNPAVLANEHKNLQNMLARLNVDKADQESDRTKIEIDRDVEREGLGDDKVSPEEVQAVLDKEEHYQQGLAYIAALQQDIEVSYPFYKDGMNNKVIKGKKLLLARAQAELQDYEALRVLEIRDELAERKRADIQNALARYETKLRKIQRYIDVLDTKIKLAEKELNRVKNVAFDTQEFEDDLKNYPLLDQLRKEIHILTSERDALPRVALDREAGEKPALQEQPSQIRKIAMAGFGALGLVLAGVALLEYRTRRIHTVSEVVQNLGLRLLGAIPTWSPQAQNRAGYGGTMAYNLWTESVDTARTLVTHAAQAESARVVMITSAVSGEGKTSLASHLASSLARAGHRTLLVDGDLRSPAVHALFDRPLGPGLCEVLRGQVALDDAIQDTPARGLALLTAGTWDGEALQVLAQGRAQDVFAQLKEQYDYVIVDSSPVLAVADALMIGRHVDGVLISILRDVSRVPTTYAAYQRLTMLGIRTLGAVVNGAESERYGSWYNAPPTAA